MSATVWTSSSLLYRALDPSDDAFLARLSQHSLSFTQSSHALPKPNGLKDAAATREFLGSCLLGLLICLPVDDPSRRDPSLPLNHADNSTPIGFLHFNAIADRERHHRQTDLGISLVSEYQGKGYGSEAIRWALRWGFQFAGLHRIGIGAFEYNERAVKLYKRIGFVYEGTKREALWFDGRWWGIVELSMLEHEYRERYGNGGRGVGGA